MLAIGRESASFKPTIAVITVTAGENGHVVACNERATDVANFHAPENVRFPSEFSVD